MGIHGAHNDYHLSVFEVWRNCAVSTGGQWYSFVSFHKPDMAAGRNSLRESSVISSIWFARVGFLNIRLTAHCRCQPVGAYCLIDSWLGRSHCAGCPCHGQCFHLAVIGSVVGCFFGCHISTVGMTLEYHGIPRCITGPHQTFTTTQRVSNASSENGGLS